MLVVFHSSAIFAITFSGFDGSYRDGPAWLTLFKYAAHPASKRHARILAVPQLCCITQHCGTTFSSHHIGAAGTSLRAAEGKLAIRCCRTTPCVSEMVSHTKKCNEWKAIERVSVCEKCWEHECVVLTFHNVVFMEFSWHTNRKNKCREKISPSQQMT